MLQDAQLGMPSSGASAVGFVFWESEPPVHRAEHTRGRLSRRCHPQVTQQSAFLSTQRRRPAHARSSETVGLTARFSCTATRRRRSVSNALPCPVHEGCVVALLDSGSVEAGRVDCRPSVTVLLDAPRSRVKRGVAPAGNRSTGCIAAEVAKRRRRVFLAGGLTPVQRGGCRRGGASVRGGRVLQASRRLQVVKSVERMRVRSLPCFEPRLRAQKVTREQPMRGDDGSSEHQG